MALLPQGTHSVHWNDYQLAMTECSSIMFPTTVKLAGAESPLAGLMEMRWSASQDHTTEVRLGTVVHMETSDRHISP